MNEPSIIVVVILAVTVVLFVSDRLPLDLVSLMSLAALMVSGVLTPAEALAGFSNPIVLMIAGLFVVGAALQNSGVASWLGEQLSRFGGSTELRLVVVIMAASAVLSSFMSSTGTVAILLPVVLAIARRAGINPARLLIPLAFASLMGGMLTLIGTPPNIVVNDELRRNGAEVFGFFSYTAPGLVLGVIGIGFMALFGRRLLPGSSDKRTDEQAPKSITQPELAAVYGVATQLASVQIAADSPLVDKSLRSTDIRSHYGATVLGIRRGDDDGEARRVDPSVVLRAGDRLRLLCPEPAELQALLADKKLQRLPDDHDLMLPPEETMAELVLPRRSSYVGRTLRDIGFRTRHHSTVLALQRGGKTLPGPMTDVVLKAGDTLLVKGSVKSIGLLDRSRRRFVVLTQLRPAGEGALDVRAATPALLATALMLVLMTFQLVPNVLAVLLAAIGVVLFRSLTTVEAYRRINWESVIVVAAVLPMSTALQKTGVLDLLVTVLVDRLGSAGPLALMAALFVVTSVASQVISNTATSVLVAPVAFSVASQLGMAPQPFLMAVALAASTAFATPIASPVNMLVLNAGGYRFTDFIKVGVPLQLVMFVVTMVIVPLMFPFGG